MAWALRSGCVKKKKMMMVIKAVSNELFFLIIIFFSCPLVAFYTLIKKEVGMEGVAEEMVWWCEDEER